MEQKEYDNLEADIELAEEVAEKQRAELSEAEGQGLGYSELADLYSAIEQAEAKVEALTERYFYLAEKKEACERGEWE